MKERPPKPDPLLKLDLYRALLELIEKIKTTWPLQHLEAYKFMKDDQQKDFEWNFLFVINSINELMPKPVAKFMSIPNISKEYAD